MLALSHISLCPCCEVKSNCQIDTKYVIINFTLFALENSKQKLRIFGQEQINYCL
jgi:hypothetical protein